MYYVVPDICPIVFDTFFEAIEGTWMLINVVKIITKGGQTKTKKNT